MESSQDLKLTFLGWCQPIFSVTCQMEKCGCQKVSIRFFPHYETQKREVFQDFSLHENIPTPKRLQESDSKCKGIKAHVAHD